MNRRDLVRSLAVALALPAIARGEAERLFAAGRRAHRRAGRAPGVLDPHQRETVATLAELIFPATDTPGARAAGVHDFVDVMLAEWYSAEERDRFLAGLADVDARARAAYGADFLGATDAQRGELLHGFDAEVQALRGAKQDPDRHFFQRMKFLTLYGYFTSEAGATAELHYVAIPGSYDGCTGLGNASAAPGDFG
jgi:gluconate 2-dehydrogenase gamma chain